MKLEKEVYIGNVYYTETLDKKYHLSFNCIVYNYLNEREKEIFNKLQEKTKIKLTLEVQDPILDEAERKYLSGVIRPFRKETAIIRIKKHKSIFENCEEIGIDTFYIGCGHTTNLPPFKKGTMYKNMELNKEYLLEELGL